MPMYSSSVPKLRLFIVSDIFASIPMLLPFNAFLSFWTHYAMEGGHKQLDAGYK
jgi:hypothetical protein